jgi:hypothetical protein
LIAHLAALERAASGFQEKRAESEASLIFFNNPKFSQLRATISADSRGQHVKPSLTSPTRPGYNDRWEASLAMPLRDHFRPPLDDSRSWDELHGAWPTVIVMAWTHTLGVGQPLPTVPLWLADNLAVPLELETSYEQTCRILRIL